MKIQKYKLEGIALWRELIRAGISADERGFVTNNSPVMNPKQGGFDIISGRIGYKQDFFPNFSFGNKDVIYRIERGFEKNGDK